jgi:hypothetical protein
MGRGEPGGFDAVSGEEGEQAVDAHGGAEDAARDVGGVCRGAVFGVEPGGVRSTVGVYGLLGGGEVHQPLTASMSTP